MHALQAAGRRGLGLTVFVCLHCTHPLVVDVFRDGLQLGPAEVPLQALLAVYLWQRPPVNVARCVVARGLLHVACCMVHSRLRPGGDQTRPRRSWRSRTGPHTPAGSHQRTCSARWVPIVSEQTTTRTRTHTHMHIHAHAHACPHVQTRADTRKRICTRTSHACPSVTAVWVLCDPTQCGKPDAAAAERAVLSVSTPRSCVATCCTVLHRCTSGSCRRSRPASSTPLHLRHRRWTGTRRTPTSQTPASPVQSRLRCAQSAQCESQHRRAQVPRRCGKASLGADVRRPGTGCAAQLCASSSVDTENAISCDRQCASLWSYIDARRGGCIVYACLGACKECRTMHCKRASPRVCERALT